MERKRSDSPDNGFQKQAAGSDNCCRQEAEVKSDVKESDSNNGDG